MPKFACVEDFRKHAERRVPRMFYDYADSGSWTESTYRANETDLQALKFRQRVGIDVSQRSTQIHGGGCLTHAAFLIDHRDNVRLPPPCVHDHAPTISVQAGKGSSHRHNPPGLLAS